MDQVPGDLISMVHLGTANREMREWEFEGKRRVVNDD